MARKLKAVGVQAEVVMAYCPCGGEAIDDRTASFSITADSKLVCNVCEAELTLPKRAQLWG